MKTTLLEKLRAAVEEWAQEHQVETAFVDIKYSGIGSNVHVTVVARQGFDNWPWYERDRNLFQFLHDKINSNGELFISSLGTMTEAEYEKYEGVAA